MKPYSPTTIRPPAHAIIAPSAPAHRDRPTYPHLPLAPAPRAVNSGKRKLDTGNSATSQPPGGKNASSPGSAKARAAGCPSVSAAGESPLPIFVTGAPPSLPFRDFSHE